MRLDNLLSQLVKEKPLVVYLSGKTCTGESTFARQLKAAADYDIVDLDTIVVGSVVKPLQLKDENTVFVEVYRREQERDWIDRFVAATTATIDKKHATNQPIVIDGAVANANTLASIFKNYPDFTFIYFHPDNLNSYIRNLTSRFMLATADFSSGLPKRFWELVDDAEFREFCRTRLLTRGLKDSIQEYAQSSQTESTKRLESFREKFEQIIVVNV